MNFRATLLLLLFLSSTPSQAWEPKTHAGLTEQSAIRIRFHQLLIEQFGLTEGWYTRLQVDPKSAPELFALLEKLSPSDGLRPDDSGTMSAGSWLMAGSALANLPGNFGANHFLDPTAPQKKGLRIHSADKWTAKGLRLLAKAWIQNGSAANQWITDPKNPYRIDAFFSHYAKTVSAKNPKVRQQHAALTLFVAGALLHVLQDMGHPGHTRNDALEFLQRVDPQGSGVGSLLSRVAETLFGRLAVPLPSSTVSFPTLAEYFVNTHRTGLADKTERRWFSHGTLPHEISVRPREHRQSLNQRLKDAVDRPSPAPLLSPDAIADARLSPGPWLRLENQFGTCLAEFKVIRYQLRWRQSEKCLTEQAKALVSLTGAYSAGFLQLLFAEAAKRFPSQKS